MVRQFQQLKKNKNHNNLTQIHLFFFQINKKEVFS